MNIEETERWNETLIEAAELRADRDRARDLAVALEQENARLREVVAETASEAHARYEALLERRDKIRTRNRLGAGDMARGLEQGAYEIRRVGERLQDHLKMAAPTVDEHAAEAIAITREDT